MVFTMFCFNCTIFLFRYLIVDNSYAGSAIHFKDCFPISPRQPIRRKADAEITNGSDERCLNDSEQIDGAKVSSANDTPRKTNELTPDRPHRNPKYSIDRAKPRKSPCRPLPGVQFLTLFSLCSNYNNCFLKWFL